MDPPIRLEEDPQYSALPLAETAEIASRLAVVVTAPSLGEQAAAGWPILHSASAAVDGTQTDLEAREYSWSPAEVDVATDQRRLGALLSWALTGGEPVVELSPAATGSSAPARLQGRLRTAALAEGAELLVHMEMSECRASWVRRDGLWWFANFALFYGPGIYPVVLIPDEVYDVSLRAEASIVHPGSGLSLSARTFLATHERSLNDAQRGWSLSGLLFLYPYTLDEDDYAHVFAALLPHARKELERQIVTWLRAELPRCLAQRDVQALPSGSLAGRWTREHDGSVFELEDDGRHVRGRLVGREDVFASYRFDVSRERSGVLKGRARIVLSDAPEPVETAWELTLRGEDLRATVEWVEIGGDGEVVGRGTEEQVFVRVQPEVQADETGPRKPGLTLPASHEPSSRRRRSSPRKRGGQ